MSCYFKNQQELGHVMRKPTFYICENKDPDQLCGDSEADQGLLFLLHR